MKWSMPSWLSSTAILIGFFGFWEFYVVANDVSRFILPPPSEIVVAFVDLLADDRTYRHLFLTIYQTLMGFLIATIVGVGLGALLGKSRWLEQALNPFIIATQVVPKVALVPLFVLWFGFGPESKIVVATVLAFFPILTNTILGVKSVERGHKDVMTVLNASRWQAFRTVELPNALPAILAGMEVGIVLAIIGSVVGEYLGGATGLGYLLVASMNDYQVGRLFAVIVLLTIVGFSLYVGIRTLKRALIPWHESVLLSQKGLGAEG